MCMNTQEVFISNKIYKKPERFLTLPVRRYLVLTASTKGGG